MYSCGMRGTSSKAGGMTVLLGLGSNNPRTGSMGMMQQLSLIDCIRIQIDWMKNADIIKIRQHFSELLDNKTLIITKDAVASFVGKCTEVQKYKMYTLHRSIGPRNIKNDELYHKLKPAIISTASVNKQQALIILQTQLKEYYPYNNINIWIWEAKGMEHSGWGNSTAWATFKFTQDNSYGHDVLIIIK